MHVSPLSIRYCLKEFNEYNNMHEYLKLFLGVIFIILFLRIVIWLTKNSLFNNFPFSIIRIIVYLYLISGVIGVLSGIYYGIILLWKNFSNKLLISCVALIFAYLIFVVECFRLTNILKKIKKKSASD